MNSVMSWKVYLALALMYLSEGIRLLLLLPLMQLAGLDVQQGNIGRLAELASAMLNATGLRLMLTTVLILCGFISGLHAMISTSSRSFPVRSPVERSHFARTGPVRRPGGL